MSSQLDLFGPTPRVLIDDATGRIAYYPALLPHEEAASLFVWLLGNAPWNAETMWMYDHMVDVPRLVARYAIEELPEPLDRARERVETFLGERFASVGLNYYRDGRDSVAWHNDHLADMPSQPTIALLSLGATRRMQVRTKRAPRIVHGIDLDAGSLFVMSGRSQEFWEHTIAKSPRPTDARISVAFRPRRLGNAEATMNSRKSDRPNDEKPQPERDVQSDRPYYEDASVPGDNDVRTALDPQLEKKAQR